MRAWPLLVVLLVAGAARPAAQDQKLRFEVASVKRNVAGAPGFGGPTATSAPRPTGFVATNVTLQMLIRRAYDIDERYIVGGPGWVQTQRFDINASAAREVSRDEVNAMLRALLAERFKLVVAREQRERDAYTLRLARADGRPGPDLQKVADDCNETRLKDPVARFKSNPPLRPSNGALPSSGASCTTLETVAGHVAKALDATVIDETGLPGRWDFVISHTGRQSGTKPDRSGALREYPSIFAAVEEQLGLKLERRREPGSYEVLVIKSVELPSEN